MPTRPIQKQEKLLRQAILLEQIQELITVNIINMLAKQGKYFHTRQYIPRNSQLTSMLQKLFIENYSIKQSGIKGIFLETSMIAGNIS